MNRLALPLKVELSGYSSGKTICGLDEYSSPRSPFEATKVGGKKLSQSKIVAVLEIIENFSDYTVLGIAYLILLSLVVEVTLTLFGAVLLALFEAFHQLILRREDENQLECSLVLVLDYSENLGELI